MFFLGDRVELTASSVKSGPGPKRGSVGYVAQYPTFGAGTISSHSQILPLRHFLTEITIVFTRFGFEKRHRVEKKTVTAILLPPPNQILPHRTQEDLDKFKQKLLSPGFLGDLALDLHFKRPLVVIKPCKEVKSLKDYPQEFEASTIVLLKQQFLFSKMKLRQHWPNVNEGYTHPEFLRILIEYGCMTRKREELRKLFDWAYEKRERQIGLMLTARQLMGLWNRCALVSNAKAFNLRLRSKEYGPRFRRPSAASTMKLVRVLCSAAYRDAELERYLSSAIKWLPDAASIIYDFRNSMNDSY